MPFISVATNTSLDTKSDLGQRLSGEIASMLGKPESYVMVWLQDCQTINFAGNDKPTAYVQLKSLGLDPDQTTRYSQHLCGLLNELTDIPQNRIYIEFTSPDRHMWGWDNKTFG